MARVSRENSSLNAKDDLFEIDDFQLDKALFAEGEGGLVDIGEEIFENLASNPTSHQKLKSRNRKQQRQKSSQRQSSLHPRVEVQNPIVKQEPQTSVQKQQNQQSQLINRQRQQVIIQQQQAELHRKEKLKRDKMKQQDQQHNQQKVLGAKSKRSVSSSILDSGLETKRIKDQVSQVGEKVGSIQPNSLCNGSHLSSLDLFQQQQALNLQLDPSKIKTSCDFVTPQEQLDSRQKQGTINNSPPSSKSVQDYLMAPQFNPFQQAQNNMFQQQMEMSRQLYSYPSNISEQFYYPGYQMPMNPWQFQGNVPQPYQFQAQYMPQYGFQQMGLNQPSVNYTHPVQTAPEESKKVIKSPPPKKSPEASSKVTKPQGKFLANRTMGPLASSTFSRLQLQKIFYKANLSDKQRKYRQKSLENFRGKRKYRRSKSNKLVRYTLRKINADNRPRVKGRFIKKN